jgi:hypothetical protein
LKRLLVWIVILAVVALLATVMPRVAKAPSHPSASGPVPAWHTIASFRGAATGATAPFVTNRRWRVVWTAGPAPQPTADFGILVEQPDSGVPYDTIANTIGSGHGTHVEEGSGTFYLDVQTGEPYTVEVQTYASTPHMQPRYAWRSVLTASDSASKTIALPPLRSPWRIAWQADGGTAQGSFAISVMQAGQDLPVDFVANVTGSASAVAYEYRSGTFQLKVAASEPYKITVQEGRQR